MTSDPTESPCGQPELVASRMTDAQSLAAAIDEDVQLHPHDLAWAEVFELERARLQSLLPGSFIAVEHIGSTAVPGLAAKPIVDLQVAVAATRPQALYVGPLERLGYLFAPDPESPDFHFFGKPAERPRTYHLHVCVAGSEDERRHLTLRDYLRPHPDEGARYAARKREVAARHPQDRLAYIEGKADYVTALERRALAWARERGD